MKPILSIVLPTYELTSGLQRLSEVLEPSEKYQECIEVVVSDDSVTDVVKEFVQKHKIFKYFKHDGTGNPVDNWNNGISLAKGQFIHLLHHDEYFKDQVQFDNLIDILLDTKVDVVLLKCMLSRRWTHALLPTSYVASILATSMEILHFKNFIGSPSNVIFKNDANFFDPNFIYLVDVHFYFALQRKYGLLQWKVSRIQIISDLKLFAENSITKSISDRTDTILHDELRLLGKEFPISKKLSYKNLVTFNIMRLISYVSF